MRFDAHPSSLPWHASWEQEVSLNASTALPQLLCSGCQMKRECCELASGMCSIEIYAIQLDTIRPSSNEISLLLTCSSGVASEARA